MTRQRKTCVRFGLSARCILTALTVLIASVVFAQAMPLSRSLPAAPDTAVWLVNIYPGAEIFQLEGHTALVVKIGSRPAAAYNYGVFDFNSPGFVWRFVKGQTDYMVVKWPFDAFMAEYIHEGRRVVAHHIDLDAKQKKELVKALDTNALPQNRTYRYNYVKDNCATRPLDAIEAVLPDSIRLAPALFESNSGVTMTYRNIMRHYHRHYPWYQFGIDLALGSGIDYPLTRREAAFAPVELDAMIKNSTTGGRRLVDRTEVLFDVSPDNALEAATPWWAGPQAAAIALLVVTVMITWYDFRHRRLTKWFDSVLFGIIGLTGCLLTFLIFVSVHEATSPNYLYLWLNPLALFPAVCVWLKKCKVALFWFQSVNFAVLLALVLLWPLLPQSANPAFLPVIASEMLRTVAFIRLNRQ